RCRSAGTANRLDLPVWSETSGRQRGNRLRCLRRALYSRRGSLPGCLATDYGHEPGRMMNPKPMHIPFVDLKAQYGQLKTQIDARIKRVLDHGQFILGPEVAELEQRLASLTGSRHCISCASGTDAMLIALMALGVGPGDEVIT